jgi:hypothetical protein
MKVRPDSPTISKNRTLPRVRGIQKMLLLLSPVFNKINIVYYFCRLINLLYYCNRLGHVAEWLGMGLQNLVRRFDPARDLCEKLNLMAVVRGVCPYAPFYLEQVPVKQTPVSIIHTVAGI